MTRFRIVVPAFDCVEFLPRCLASLERQRGVELDVCVVDDASTDPRQRPIIEEFCRRNGWRSLFRTRNEGSLASLVAGIDALDPHDDDVLGSVDGDDLLLRPDALGVVARTYAREDSWLTYGQNIRIPSWRRGFSRAIDDAVVRERRHRAIPWAFSHPRTFKAWLWRLVRDEDLRDGDGSYSRATTDRAVAYPMVEMAGYHVSFIPRVLYGYNVDNPISDFRIRRDDQLRVDRLLRRRTPYEPLPSHKSRLGPTARFDRLSDRREWEFAARRALAFAGRALTGGQGT